MGPLTLRVTPEEWPLRYPFQITGYRFESLPTVLVEVEREDCVGRGEGAGVYYKGDTPTLMLQQIQSLKGAIEAGVDRKSLQLMLPPGGARNALDCALWDLEAKLNGLPAWETADLETPHPLLTTFTCGAAAPEEMAAAAQKFSGARAIKLKLTGEASDADRVRAVRTALPDVWLGVDANQGFTQASLEKLMPVLVENAVSLIEQPFPIGQDHWLDGIRAPIPIAADESVQSLAQIDALAGRVQVINIKLDKCGGLTEGLLMARKARSLGLNVMVGNMMGTSLAMAPAYLLGQLCDLVDLDGPVAFKHERPETVQYVEGWVSCPASLWGNPPV